MTFIGVSCNGQSAQVVTDEVGYSHHGARFRRTTKQQRFDHLSAVVMTSGNGRLAKHAEWHADFAANNSDTFDDLVAAVPHWYGEYAIRDAEIDPKAKEGMSGSIVLVGYSEAGEEFAAYVATARNPTPVRLTTTYLQPAPWSLAATPQQVKQCMRDLRALEVPEEDIAALYRNWQAAPPVPTPETDEQWVELASLVRDQRSLSGSFMRIWIAGRLTLTTLTTDGLSSRTIHEFDDTADLEQLVSGSLHPVAQLMPCTDCDSGRPAIECCLPGYYFGETCDCGGPDRLPFEECCAVTGAEEPRRTLWSPATPFK